MTTTTALKLASDIIRESEGCRTVAYADSAGIPTIGFGRTKGVTLGMICSRTQADAWLLDDMASAAATVAESVKVPLTDHQRAALISFVFNVGCGAFNSSTLLRLLNVCDYAGAAKQFLVWNKAGGKVISGLVKRRTAEASLFNTADTP